MPSTPFDSAIFRDVFGAPAMRAVFSDEATEAAVCRLAATAGGSPQPKC